MSEQVLKFITDQAAPWAFILSIALAVGYGIRAVWKFFRPIASRIAEATMNFFDRQNKFIETLDTRLTSIEHAAGCRGPDHTPKLEAIHDDVLDIKRHVVGRGLGS